MSGPLESSDLTRCEEFHGLRARAFSLTPDLRFVFGSRSHTRAFEQVADALRRREGLIVITGEIGTGKTVLCRTLLETFREVRTFLSVILDPSLGVDDLLTQVLVDFGLMARSARTRGATMPEATRHELVTTLQQFLASLIPLNAHAVIMIDEAQHLSPTVLEQIRLLSNFETDEAKLLQIVLVGQPDLDELLARPEVRQLSQRIARRFELHALSDDEVGEYVARRWSVASAEAMPFTPAAIGAVRRISRGIPRLVNTVCDAALTVGCERETRTIDADVVVAAAERLKLPVGAATKWRPRWTVAAAASIVLVALLGGWWWLAPPRSIAPVSPPPQATRPTLAPRSAPARNTPAQPAAPPPAAVVPPPRSPVPSSGPERVSYRIDVAAFRTSKRAIDTATDIAAKGLPASTRSDPTGQWYLVVVGPFATPEAAYTAQLTLARQGFGGTRISSGASDK